MIIKSGVYCLTNTVTGLKYIGSSKDIYSRISGHIRYFKEGKNSQYLQEAWDKYGDVFEFEILEECPEDVLFEREDYYINKFNTIYPNGYNIRGAGYTGKMHEVTKEKISKTILKVKPSGFKNKKHKEETKKRISESMKGKNKGPNNGMYGRKLSHEEKAAISERFSGKNNPRAKFTDTELLKAYEMLKTGKTVREVSDILGMSPSTVQNIKKGRHWICKENNLPPLS